MPEITRELLASAIAGDRTAIAAVVRELTPVIHARVGRVLLRRRGLVQGEPRQRVEDLVQDVFVELFRDGAKALRTWDPARGMSLRNWVGLIAEQRATAALRGHRAAVLSLEDASEPEAPPRDDPELRLLSRDHLTRLVDRLRSELSPIGLQLFHDLVVQEEAIASVAARTGMSIAAVQAWSSRLKRRIASLVAELDAETRSPGLE